MSEESSHSIKMHKLAQLNWLSFGPRPGYPSKDSVPDEVVDRFVESLYDNGIRRIVSLLDAGSSAGYYQHPLLESYAGHNSSAGLEIISFPIPRFGYPQRGNRPDYDGYAGLLRRLVQDEEKLTYMHCSGGRGRCGVILSGLLYLKGFSLDESIHLARGNAALRDDGQEQFVRAWAYRSLIKKEQ